MSQDKNAYSFEQALAWLKGRRKIKRRGWNGQGMYIYLVEEHNEQVTDLSCETAPLISLLGEGTDITIASRIDMRYANGKYGVWTPTAEDLLAQDWNLLT